MENGFIDEAFIIIMKINLEVLATHAQNFVALQKRKQENKYEGFVDGETCLGKGRFYIRNGTVVLPTAGENGFPIGYVKDGIAYEEVIGGKPVPIGRVTQNN